MAESPKISVIMPVHNAERFLCECLDSVLCQTLKEFELICVDDASTDRSAQILQNYARLDSRITVLTQPTNKRAAAARNLAMKTAGGEYMTFWDSDDFFEPDALEIMYSQCVSDQADICVCRARAYNMATNRIESINNSLELMNLPPEQPFAGKDFPEQTFRFTTPAPWNKLFKSSFIKKEKLEFQNILRSNDFYFVYMALSLAKRITVVDRILINYRRATATSLQETSTGDLFDFYRALTALKQGLIERDIFDIYEKAFIQFSMGYCIYYLSIQKTKSDWHAIALKLKLEILEELKCTDKPLDYFLEIQKYQYSEMQIILDMTVDELDEYEPRLRIDEQSMVAQNEKRSNTGVAPKVSVIIPVYNAERFLNECLNSVINQTLQEIEVLCVDDASTDNSAKILADYANKDSRIKVLTQPYNQLAWAARNRGIEESCGKYLVFWDSDDFFEPDALKLMYEQCEQDDADVCVCDGILYDMTKDEKVLPSHYLQMSMLPKEMPFVPSEHPDIALLFTSPGPFNKMLRKEFLIFNNLRFQDLKRSEDVVFIMMAVSLAKKATVVNQRLVTYRRGTSSSAQETLANSPKDFYTALLTLHESLTNHGLYDCMKTAFANFSLSVCLYNLDFQKTKLAWLELVTLLRNEAFAKLGCVGLAKSTAISNSQYERMKTILEYSEEDLTVFEPDLREDEESGSASSKKRTRKAKQIKVSVIIAVYNTENYLEECLRSVMRQSLKEIEIICIDDGSADSSRSILQRLQKEDSRIQIVSQKNQGQSVARNIGLNIACGEFIQFLDSDDMLAWCALERLYKEAKSNELDVLFYAGEAFYDPIELYKSHSDKRTYYHYKKNTYNEVLSGQNLYLLLRKNKEFKVSAAPQLLRRAFISKHQIRFYPGIIHEDNLLTLTCIMLAERSMVSDEPLYLRRIRSGSTTTEKKTWHHTEGYMISISESVDEMVKHEIDNLEFLYELCAYQIEIGRIAAKNVTEVETETIEDGLQNLSPKVRNRLAFYLQLLMTNHNLAETNKICTEKLIKKDNELEKLKHDSNMLNNELISVQKSRAYRIIRFFTKRKGKKRH